MIKSIIYILFSVVSVITITGCEENFDPIDDDNGLYSVYGVLQSQRNFNYIRVRDLSAPFTLEATEMIDAELTLENLDNGTSQQLSSNRTEFDEVYIHNFEALNILPDTEYRLEVKRSDGRFLDFRTKTPKIISTTVTPLSRDCKTTITIEFENSTDGGNIQLQTWEVPVDDDVNEPGVDITSGDFIKEFYITGAPIITLKPDPQNISTPLSYEFKPINYNPLSIVDECNEMVIDKLYVTYIYFSQGLQEKVSDSEFDVTESISRFGAVYIDTLTIPFDTTLTN